MRLDDANCSFRFNQDGLRMFLGDLETEIMETVWAAGDRSITVRDVFEILKKQREIAYTTVMTTMNRLAEKEILSVVDKVGLANCYVPSYPKDEFVARYVERLLDSLLEHFPEQVLGYLSKLAKTQRK